MFTVDTLIGERTAFWKKVREQICEKKSQISIGSQLFEIKWRKIYPKLFPFFNYPFFILIFLFKLSFPHFSILYSFRLKLAHFYSLLTQRTFLFLQPNSFPLHLRYLLVFEFHTPGQRYIGGELNEEMKIFSLPAATFILVKSIKLTKGQFSLAFFH